MSGDRAEWYYVGDSGQIGPLSEEWMLDLAESGVIQRETPVWKVGMSSWTQAGAIPRIASRMPGAAVPPPLENVSPGPTPPPRTGPANCPRDGSPLKRDVREGVEIDWCPRCKGVWLDRGELEKLMEGEGRYWRRDREDDDDDRYDRDRFGRRKRRGFLDDVFDIFD